MRHKPKSFKERLQPLEDLTDALAAAKEAKELLDVFWNHFGPYGHFQVPDEGLSEKFQYSKEFQDFLKANEMPPGFLARLQRFYDFDDSE